MPRFELNVSSAARLWIDGDVLSSASYIFGFDLFISISHFRIADFNG